MICPYLCFSARMLDDIHYQETGQVEPRICKEDPSVEILVPPDSTPKAKDQLQQPAFEKNQDVIIPNLSEASKHSPKHALRNYYQKIHVKFDDDAFQTILQKDVKNNAWWSATCTCPQTGKVYNSGSLNGDDDSQKYHKGVAFYPKIKTALQAVAARIIDAVVYESTGSTEGRLCQEDPSFPDAPYVHPDSINRQLRVHEQSTKQNIGVTFFEEENDDDESDDDEQEDDDYFEEDEEEYVLQDVISFSNATSSTLSRVAQIWSEQEAEMPESPSPLQPLTRSRSDLEARTFKQAQAWFESCLQPSSANNKHHFFMLFQKRLPIGTLEAGNMILKVLSKSVFRSRSVGLGEQIFDMLQKREKPNINTYNYFLQLLRAQTEPKCLKRLENILQGLFNDEGMPDPDLETFKVALAVYAARGETNKCAELYQKMLSMNISPDKEIFIIILQSIGQRGCFDSSSANDWIDTAREHHFEIDSEFLEAPLPWSAKRIRRFRPANMWEQCGNIFANGFREEAEDSTLDEARKIEDWVTKVESQNQLQKEGYNAIVEAWVKVGTRDAVAKAKVWAERAVEMEKADFSTFHTILAAMALSGDDPKELKDLLERLEIWSETEPSLRPDSRAKSVVVRALSRHQQALLDQGKFDEAAVIADENLADLGRQCQDLISSYANTNDPYFIEITSFVLVLRSIRSIILAEFVNETPGPKSTQNLLKVVSLFNDTMKGLCLLNESQRLHALDEDTATKKSNTDSLELQMLHLLVNAPLMYKEFLQALHSLDQHWDGASIFDEFLPEIEEMLLKSEEIRQFVPKNTEERNSVPFVVAYSDAFIYPMQISGQDADLFQLHEQIIQHVLEIKNTDSIAHKGQLYLAITPMIIQNNGKSADGGTSKKTYDAIGRMIADVSSSLETRIERASLCKKIIEVAETVAEQHGSTFDSSRIDWNEEESDTHQLPVGKSKGSGFARDRISRGKRRRKRKASA